MGANTEPIVTASGARESSRPGPVRKIGVFIVDDELLARVRIRNLLSAEPDLEVVGESDNGPDAVSFIGENRPDLFFLDVQMPSMNGLELLRALPLDRRPLTIFVTAHARHAVEAFEFQAVEYLLKPVSAPRFAEALQRARQCLLARPFETIAKGRTVPLPVYHPGQITVKSANRTVFIAAEEIDYIDSAANYAIIHVGAETHILRETLTMLMRRLPEDGFVRISRGAIVNVTSIAQVRQHSRWNRVVVLKSGKNIRMTCGVREICRRMENLRAA